ncbi:MAG: hypothetical protein V3T31_03105 [candidate division Zixibacteria bacterium]
MNTQNESDCREPLAMRLAIIGCLTLGIIICSSVRSGTYECYYLDDSYIYGNFCCQYDNYGSDTTVIYGNNRGSRYNALFRPFGVSDSIEAGATITACSVCTYIQAQVYSEGLDSIFIYRVQRTRWDEDTVTWRRLDTACQWRTMGASAAADTANEFDNCGTSDPSDRQLTPLRAQVISSGLSGSYKCWDLTDSMGQQFYDGAFTAGIIILTNEGSAPGYPKLTAQSSEAVGNRPFIKFTYNTGGRPIRKRRLLLGSRDHPPADDPAAQAIYDMVQTEESSAILAKQLRYEVTR